MALYGVSFPAAGAKKTPSPALSVNSADFFQTAEDKRGTTGFSHPKMNTVDS